MFIRIIAGVAIAAVIVGCSVTLPSEPSSAASGVPSTTASPARPTPTPVGSFVVVGALDDDGVPTSVEGVAVLRGDALRAAISGSIDSSAILGGGWFHGPLSTAYCTLQLFEEDRAVSICNSIGLFEHRVGGSPVRMAAGDVRDAANVSTAVDRPVVLRLHTHDARCVPQDKGCDLRPVALDIAWLGDAPLEPPPPRVAGTPPPDGITRAKAIQRARAESLAHRSPLVLRSAVASPIWAVLPGLEASEGDIWVWTVVFEADFTSPCGDCQSSDTEEVFLEYLTGAFIMARQ
ncbi:MAG TPA: hypothetical protein VIF63_04575 [Candidatus Limnocylindrales bacterium]